VSAVGEDAVGSLANPEAEVLLLDGGLAPDAIRRVLDALPPPGAAARPAVVVVGSARARRRLERLAKGEVDDFVEPVGSGELLARVRGALRARGYVHELNRKNAELQALYARLEGMARRMAEELRVAGNVQRSLLPPPLCHPGLDVAREFIPFRELGGDYYDLVPLGPSRLAFAIGDVMGKGVSAALLAANLKACLRAHLQAGEVPVAALLARVNQLFREVTPRGLFATLFFGVFDLDHGTLEYANAGHDYPFVMRPDGTIVDLVEGGTVLGLVEGGYDRGEVRLGAGDLLVFYSDGVTDREDGSGEAYGVERLKDAARRSRADDARLVLYTLLGEVQGWSGGTPPEDDMTLVVAKVR
jgi:sigma-B regulation protein RsbU (phosphoserine phosphatase)